MPSSLAGSLTPTRLSDWTNRDRPSLYSPNVLGRDDGLFRYAVFVRAALEAMLVSRIESMEAIVKRITPLIPQVISQFQQKAVERM